MENTDLFYSYLLSLGNINVLFYNDMYYIQVSFICHFILQQHLTLLIFIQILCFFKKLSLTIFHICTSKELQLYMMEAEVCMGVVFPSFSILYEWNFDQLDSNLTELICQLMLCFMVVDSIWCFSM